MSNLPEAIGASTGCATRAAARATIRRIWLAVAVVCTPATVAGYAIADTASGEFRAGVNGFAAGALLVMLVDSMIPEATRQAGDPPGW